MPTNSRRLACALSIVVAGLALAAPAGAQLAGGRSAFNQRPSPSRFSFGATVFGATADVLSE